MKLSQRVTSLFLVLSFLAVFVIPAQGAWAQGNVCGNGQCQASQDETCLTCPLDCGVCALPTATPALTPAPIPTSTSVPTVTPTQTPAPTPTTAPTSTPVPTSDPTPTPEITPTSTPEATPTPTPTPDITTTPTPEPTLEPAGPTIAAVVLSPTPEPRPKGSEGTTTAKVSVGETSTEVAVLADVSDTVPPVVTIVDIPEQAVKESSFEFTGDARDKDGVVVSLAYSLDNGASWHPVSSAVGLGTTVSTFRVVTPTLEDGTYSVLVRARDNSGNEGFATVRTVTIDRLAPIIGIFAASIDGQNIRPNGSIIRTTSNVVTRVVVSMSGGVTQGTLTVNNQEYPLTAVVGNKLWSAEIDKATPGTYPLLLRAEDGAQNGVEKTLGTLEVQEPFTLIDSDTRVSIAKADVRLERFDTNLHQWVAGEHWTASEGVLTKVVQSGLWRLAVRAPGYRSVRTRPLSFDQPTLLSGNIELSSRGLKLIPQLIAEKVQGSVLTTSSVAAEPGDDMPHFLDKWKGKPILLTKLALWNRESLDQLSILSHVQERFGEGVVVVPILVQQSSAQFSAMIERGQYRFTGLLDETGAQTQELSPSSAVSHYFFGSDGALSATLTGFSNQAELERFITDSR